MDRRSVSQTVTVSHTSLSIFVAEQLVELGGGKTVFKSPKSDNGRTFDVPAELVPILADHLTEHVGPEADALVFTSPEGHRCDVRSSAPVGRARVPRPK